jgi:putative transposase
MPGPKPETIELSDKARSELEKLAARPKTEQRTAQRARIILKAAEGKNNSEIAREMNQSVDRVRLWRRRWLALGPIALKDLSVAERLEDLPRPGAPAQITADQICQMEQMACDAPEKTGRPISQWTGREIADEVIERGIVKSISPRHAARLLKKGRSSPT